MIVCKKLLYKNNFVWSIYDAIKTLKRVESILIVNMTN